jgi:hypothetical protein
LVTDHCSPQAHTTDQANHCVERTV